ncbi:MAG: RagB/SusD family nutrient uptake outer membrane protein [Muribaculaceae bacterium]|nr:RagB/SusD family nutrient uptake outer membrane protein [Muribaculaceae bacterium]MDE5595308.1 RagB/SusD family nutrient uptake outer membrane protein [Muribaculaceae bacterium]MDE6702297.1 RagB/SusD family nutrient uptake outer membrane protein [Muribaculaceae bacterium]
MKYPLYIISALAISSLSSCSDYLDKHSSAYDSDGYYMTDAGIAEGVTGVYRIVPFALNWEVPPTMVQDIYTAYGLQETENRTIGAGGGLTPDQSYVNSYWKGHWNIVAHANAVLEGTKGDNEEMSDAYRRSKAEAKVLRAYGYYNLVTTFGDIPFFTKSVTPTEYTVGRTDKKYIVDYIINDLTEIAERDDLEWTASVRGHVDRATAYALISRYALFAGSLDFGGEGQSYFQKAADAAKQVMEHRQLAANFADLFTIDGQKKADVRSEMLWELCYEAEGRRHMHRTRLGHTSRTAGGSSVRFPSQLLADTYECKDGLRIDKSPLYDPKKPTHNRDPRFRQTLLAHGDTMSYSSDGGATVQKLIINAYDQYARIYPNPRRPNTWGSKENKDVTGTEVTFCRHASGWLWNKYNEDLAESCAESSCDISIIRVAEVYLTYAEAMIELGKYDDASVLDAINAVRRRAGQPLLDSKACVAGENLDGLSIQDKFRQRVRRERKCELAMEGVIFTDVRRWQIGDITNEFPSYGNPIAEIKYEGLEATDIPEYSYGLDPERSNINDVAHYEHYKEKLRVRDANRYWLPHFQWWPIPRVETDRDPNLSNPDYE